jgi:hypothetical protein
MSAWLSALILAPSARTEWWAKIESDPHPASSRLRNLIAGGEEQACERARPQAAVITMYSAVVVWLSRKASRDLGTCLVPVGLYPANHHLRFVHLWPLLRSSVGVTEPRTRINPA